AYLIPQTVGAVLGEEQRGTLDLLLSTPITRWQLITEKTLAIVASLVLILSIMLATLLVSTRLSNQVELETWQALAGVWHILPISLVVIAVTLLLSVTFYNPRMVGGLAALFIIISYFVRSLSDMAQLPLLDILRRFSVFHYFSSISAMIDGVNWRADIGLMLLALVIFGLALLRFQRRDLGL
ncbi:MAG: ABC transporter permease subunit, partial [Phototrophicaceae bacterium]